MPLEHKKTIGIRGVFLLSALCVGTGFAHADSSYYSPSGWATLHQSGANRRAQPVDLPKEYRVWTALSGASTLTVPTVGPEGNIYVTTGLARGQPNLHALTLDGKELWKSAPWQTKEDFDACAILSSPIVDRDGDIYVSDCNQLWAFKPDGRVKWTIDLPLPPADAPLQQPDLPVNAFTTAIFTRDGDVLGLTNYGQVVIVDPATGALRANVFQVPGLIPEHFTQHPLSDGVLNGGLMDPTFREWAWQLIFGGDMVSANTPAVSTDGRVYVTASSVTPGRGTLHAIDIVPSEDGRLQVKIAFSSDMGPGSGSSPTLSPDEKQVYVSDMNGVFYAFDAQTGREVWQLQTRAAAGAAAVAPDGTVIALQEGDAFMVAMSADGKRLWESDISELIAQELPKRWYLGGPIGISTGNPVIVNGAVLAPVLYSYSLGWGSRRIPIPIKVKLVAIDMSTGKGIRNVVDLADDSSGITAVLPDGTIVNSLGGVLTSATAPLARFTHWLLPAGVEQVQARGGIQVARPVQ